MITFANIRNVKQKGQGYVCTLDLTINGVTETVDYYAVPDGGGICYPVLEAIGNGEFTGGITQWVAPEKSPEQKRQEALAAKWPDPFALLDDILEKGAATVKAERDAIKAANPKERK